MAIARRHISSIDHPGTTTGAGFAYECVSHSDGDRSFPVVE